MKINSFGKRSKLLHKEMIEGYLFISPWVVGFLIFIIVPIITSLILSLCKYDILNPAKFIGFENYRKLFETDPLFTQALKVTLIYSGFSVPLGIICGFAIALLMNQKLKGVSLFRTIYYLPAVVSGVAVALLWKWIFMPDAGIISILLAKVGIEGPNWLGSTAWVLPAFIIMSLWGIGGGMLIYLAGFQGIPTQLYESAELDGAGRWQKFLHITIPMMTPIILFNLIMGIIGSFQTFTQSYVMTGGGPNTPLCFMSFIFLDEPLKISEWDTLLL